MNLRLIHGRLGLYAFAVALAVRALGACGGSADSAMPSSGLGGAGAAGGTQGGSAGAAGSTTSGAGGAACGSCDDGFSCTVDSCVSGKCQHSIGPAKGATACPPGQYCTVEKGCTASPACSTDEQCLEAFKADGCKTNVKCEAASSVCTFDILDKDKDGHPPQVCGGDDCNDADPDIHPGREDTCDGLDNDCDGGADFGAKCYLEGVPQPIVDQLKTCVKGACVCNPNNMCGSACVDLQKNAGHCGSCDVSCPLPGWGCAAGKCTCPDADMCNGACTNTFVDSHNCGGCGKECPSAVGGVCSGGTCICGSSGEPNKLVCGGACVDVGTDLQNCGKCGNACPAPPGSVASCKNGMCATELVCPAGTGDCDGDPSNGCEVDTTKGDIFNCGMCGKACKGKGAWCHDSTCDFCQSLPCDGVCFDLKTDPQNCGTCGKVCDPGKTCMGGTCL